MTQPPVVARAQGPSSNLTLKKRASGTEMTKGQALVFRPFELEEFWPQIQGALNPHRSEERKWKQNEARVRSLAYAPARPAGGMTEGAPLKHDLEELDALPFSR